ncbi:hypothetical protein RO3G_03251 [Rhizopus delemar RA 99-880]|uniref:FAR1 domain-containing protein n=3 Tax=Rhizopus TaxID=4842 RepID=I1BQR7_RHIO9|nr:hypothetical protein RO3G_03251 [Rhizopus delemar RA 99-880]|eukprot:EIE78547.1 hypothetical protein RO3G_03251 [Rhizopus delemar RA 99-880]
MDPLYEKLLKTPFPTNVLAIEYCRAVCAEFGFTVKQEASANKNIYVYCSREGLPDSQRNPKPSPQRKRPSKRCDCRWRVVLSENEHKQWEFRKSMNPTASEHNHPMMSPDEMVKAWPTEVNEMIIQLARQRLQTHEIRDAVRQSFPGISWNERRFYNRLTEERKRMRQRGVVERAQRLLLLSGKLCSVVAGSEEWASVVEGDLQCMLESFCQMARIPAGLIPALTDLQPDMIRSEPGGWLAQHAEKEQAIEEGSPTKKRRPLSKTSTLSPSASPEPQKGVQLVYVPNYTLQLHLPRPGMDKKTVGRSQPTALDSQFQHPQTFGSSTFFPLASPTSSSSSTSSIPFKKQQPPSMTQSRNMITSPHQTQQAIPQTEYNMTYHHHHPSSYAIQHSSFSSYSSFATTSPPEISFFEPNMVDAHRERERPNFYTPTAVDKGLSATDEQQQEYEQRMQRTFSQPATSNFSLPMIRSSEDNNATSHWN